MSELDPAAGWHPFTDPGFVDLVGPIFVREGDGPAAYAFRAEPKHANLIGVVQGGMLMTFADRALGVTAMAAADGANCVTVQFEMQFIAAVRMGEVVTLRRSGAAHRHARLPARRPDERRPGCGELHRRVEDPAAAPGGAGMMPFKTAASHLSWHA